MAEKRNQSPVDKFPRLKRRFQLLDSLRERHLDAGTKVLSVANGSVYATDLVIIAVLKRSIDLVHSIRLLVDRWNFTASAPLLRLQLDNLLRLVYLSTLDNADAVSMEIIKGRSFRKMKDDEGKTLTDARLRDYARPLYPWLDALYKETSKFIHLSEKHCFHCVDGLDQEKRAVQFRIGEGTPNWPEPDLDAFLRATGHITDALLKTIEGWIISKDAAHGGG